MTAEITIALFTAIITAGGAWLVAYRKLSGKIATSDAAQLWQESAAIRSDYREQLAAANRRIVALEERVAKVEARNVELERENAKLKRAMKQ